MKKKIPTFREVIAVYPKFAAMERIKCEKPSEITTKNVLVGVNCVLGGAWEACGGGEEVSVLDQPISWLTRHRIGR